MTLLYKLNNSSCDWVYTCVKYCLSILTLKRFDCEHMKAFLLFSKYRYYLVIQKFPCLSRGQSQVSPTFLSLANLSGQTIVLTSILVIFVSHNAREPLMHSRLLSLQINHHCLCKNTDPTIILF